MKRLAAIGVTILLVRVGTMPGARAQDQAQRPDDGLAGVRALYASAAYEDALASLAAIEVRGTQVDQYRALCLLALGRTAEAERALEQIVTRSPRYVMDAADVSPRLVALFRDVRRRMLPAAARALFAGAKRSVDAKAYDEASSQLEDLLALVNDPDMSGEESGAADLRLLGEGFLTLVRSAQASTPAAAGSDVAVIDAPAGTTPPVVESGPRVFTSEDKDVRPPMAIKRDVPPWVPPAGVSPQLVYRGVLELVIDEQGAVTSVVLRERVAPFYDAALIESAKLWTFRPATQYGRPVPYRVFLQVNLEPRQGD